MILTVLRLAPRHPQVVADSRDVCRMHGRVLQLLGLDAEEPKGRELWAQPTPDRLLIQWRRAADPRWLPDGYATGSSAHPVRLDWRQGDRIRWAAVINPVKRHRPRVAGVRRGAGKAVPVPPVDYFAAHYPMLQVRDGVVLAEQTAVGRRPSGALVTHRRARVAGAATVLDPDALAERLVSGQGHAKAYGCGLLLVEDGGR